MSRILINAMSQFWTTSPKLDARQLCTISNIDELCEFIEEATKRATR